MDVASSADDEIKRLEELLMGGATAADVPAPAPVLQQQPPPQQQMQQMQRVLAPRTPTRGNEGVVAGVDIDRLRLWVQSTDMKDAFKKSIDNYIDQFKIAPDARRLASSIFAKAGKMRFYANDRGCYRFFPTEAYPQTGAPVSPSLHLPQYAQIARPAAPMSTMPSVHGSSAAAIASLQAATAALPSAGRAAGMTAGMAPGLLKRPAPMTPTMPGQMQTAMDAAAKRPRMDGMSSSSMMAGMLAAAHGTQFQPRPTQSPGMAHAAQLLGRPLLVAGSPLRPGMPQPGQVQQQLQQQLQQQQQQQLQQQPAPPAAPVEPESPPAASPPPESTLRTDVNKLMDVFQFADIESENEKMLPTLNEGGAPLEPDTGDRIQLDMEHIEAIVTKRAKAAGVKTVHAEVLELIAQAAQQRLRDILEELSLICRHRVEAAKLEQSVAVTSNPQRQMWLLEQVARRQAEEAQRLNPGAAQREDMVFRAQQANATALSVVGVQRAWQTAKPAGAAATGAVVTDAEVATQAARARQRARHDVLHRRLTLADLLFFLEHEPPLRKSRALYRAYLRMGA